MRAIYKKELKSYFTSAIAWVFLADCFSSCIICPVVR